MLNRNIESEYEKLDLLGEMVRLENQIGLS